MIINLPLVAVMMSPKKGLVFLDNCFHAPG